MIHDGLYADPSSRWEIQNGKAVQIGSGYRRFRKWECDAAFLTVMMEGVFQDSRLRARERWLFFHVVARCYYVAVRLGGRRAWKTCRKLESLK